MERVLYKITILRTSSRGGQEGYFREHIKNYGRAGSHLQSRRRGNADCENFASHPEQVGCGEENGGSKVWWGGGGEDGINRRYSVPQSQEVQPPITKKIMGAGGKRLRSGCVSSGIKERDQDQRRRPNQKTDSLANGENNREMPGGLGISNCSTPDESRSSRSSKLRREAMD